MPTSRLALSLDELLALLSSLASVTADADCLDRNDDRFTIRLIFSRSNLRSKGLFSFADTPSPSWMISDLIDELQTWKKQRVREEQWASKEDPGATIEDCLSWVSEEVRQENGSTLDSRLRKRFLNVIHRKLLELSERRKAGGVYTKRDEQRERDSKAWREEAANGYERTQRQREQREKTSGRPDFRDWRDPSRAYQDAFREAFRAYTDESIFRAFYGEFTNSTGGTYSNETPPPPPNGKKRWFEILGVPINADRDTIQKAYRKLVRTHQPRTSAECEDKERAERMAEINTARDEGLGGLR